MFIRRGKGTAKDENLERFFFKEGVLSLLNAIAVVRMLQVESPGRQILERSRICRMFKQEFSGSTSLEEKDRGRISRRNGASV